MRATIRALVFLVFPAVGAAGFLCLPMLPAPATPYTGPAPAGSFSVTTSVSVAPASVNVPANISLTLSVPPAMPEKPPGSDLLPQGIAIFVPGAWSVAADAAVTDGLQVGSVTGTFTAATPPGGSSCATIADYQPTLVDATTNTNSASYPAFLKTVAPGTHKARYFGTDMIANLATAAVPVNILVDQLPPPDNRNQLVVIVGDPAMPPATTTDLMCSPWSFTLTLLGTTLTGGQTVYRNPASAGSYQFLAVVASEWDADNDGVSNGYDNCPLAANPADPLTGLQTDSDFDLLGDACDPVPDTFNPNPDNDGIANGFDNCPLASNPTQLDSDSDDIGDSCDPSPVTPSGTRFVLSCTQNVAIGGGANGASSCGTLTQPVTTPTPTPTPTATATPTATPTPCANDADGDGVCDQADNCPAVPNPGQQNSDNEIDNGPGIAAKDRTVPNAVADTEGDACETDGDADNDGLPDAEDIEPLGATGICAAFAGFSDGHPSPAGGDLTNDDNGNGTPAPADAADNGPSWDTDNDGVRDGVECQLGTNPRLASSKPIVAACGGATDADLDGLPASAERCKWGTSDTNTDSDTDTRKDCVEANDTDGNGISNFTGDTINSAKAANNIIGKTMDFDLDGNGSVNFTGDTILSAKLVNHIGGICM